MNNVIPFKKRDANGKKTEIPNEYDFSQVIEKNEKNKRRVEKERFRTNKVTTRNLNLKD